MQTFLPYKDFSLVAKCLDNKRLNKQITEANQILDLITGKAVNKWINHTAVRMWQKYDVCLIYYIEAMVNEWHERGYKSHYYKFSNDNKTYIEPEWLSNPLLIQSHRNSLINKFPEHYKQFGWNYIENAPERAWWPVTPKSRAVLYSNKHWETIYINEPEKFSAIF